MPYWTNIKMMIIILISHKIDKFTDILANSNELKDLNIS